uniref:G-protein coupled receptors family 1 profile domain-containing protein n=1 Tax=Esox lucius TaxID=8010 RepID=A0A6Q2Z4Z6_ESOLU
MVPMLLDMFLFNRQFISYNQCLTSHFFVVIFHIMQSFNLTILSYDRLVAICCPLRYSMLISNRSIFQLTGAAWVLAVLVVLICIGLITRLSFCGPLYSHDLHHSILHLYHPCTLHHHTSPGQINSSSVKFHGDLSWTANFRSFQRFSMGFRHRAIKTCTAHLMLVAIYYLPMNITYLFVSFIPSNIRILNLSLTSVLPPMLNP